MARKVSMNMVDRIASEYIRRRFADSNGYVKCVTCGIIKHWKDMDCGHFIKREVLRLRYHENNMHSQCRRCNHFLSGNEAEYSEFIIKKYGIQEFNYLMNQKYLPFTGSKTLWLMAEYESYKQKLALLNLKSPL